MGLDQGQSVSCEPLILGAGECSVEVLKKT